MEGRPVRPAVVCGGHGAVHVAAPVLPHLLLCRHESAHRRHRRRLPQGGTHFDDVTSSLLPQPFVKLW